MRISVKLKIREIAGEKLVILEREQQIESAAMITLPNEIIPNIHAVEIDGVNPI